MLKMFTGVFQPMTEAVRGTLLGAVPREIQKTVSLLLIQTVKLPVKQQVKQPCGSLVMRVYLLLTALLPRLQRIFRLWKFYLIISPLPLLKNTIMLRAIPSLI